MENTIKSAVTNLNSATNPQQSATLPQVQNQDLMQNFITAVNGAVSKINGLREDGIKKDQEITELAYQNKDLGEKINELQELNKQNKDNGAWAQKVKQRHSSRANSI